MASLSELDKETPLIESGALRATLDSPSSERWAVFRSAIGMGANDRKRKLTQREAVLLTVRRYWRSICQQVDEEYKSNPDIFDLERVANKWLLSYEIDGVYGAIARLEILTEVKGKNLAALLETCLGKSVSERTIRRKCEARGMPKYRREGIYSHRQIQKIRNAIVSSAD